MKDLLIYTADADALAFLRSLLQRSLALGIEDIDYDIERHPQRDSGMIQSAAELVRMKKGKYHKVLLIWDHHGSGCEHRKNPQQVVEEMQEKLDSYTWRNNSAVTVLDPELEQWLWFGEQAIASHYKITVEQLQEWVEMRAEMVGEPTEKLRREKPKELFEFIVRERLRKPISPRDFEGIGRRISIPILEQCESFSCLKALLKKWFPR